MNTTTSTAAYAPASWWGKISLLWLMVVPIVVAIYTLLLPVAPNDFWYNVRAGAHIAATGSIPTTALFTTSITPGTPYFNQAWLSQILLFRILEAGGLSSIVLLRTFCLTAAFILILLATWRRASRLSERSSGKIEATTVARITAGSTLLAFALSASNMDVRPQVFSVPFFALFVFCIFEWSFASALRRKAIIGLLTLCMVLWANFHGAFFTGLILLGVFFAGEAVQFFLAPRSPACTRLFGSVSRRDFQQAASLFAIAVTAALFNPRGAGLYAYVFKLAALQAGQKYIQEWQAPSFSQWYGTLFWLSLALALIMAGVLLWRLKATIINFEKATDSAPGFGLRLGEIFIFGATALMALRDVRSIIWFAFVFAPFLTALGVGILLVRQTNKTPVEPEQIPRAAQIVNAIIALFLLFSIVPFLPQLRAALPLPPEYFTQFAPTPRGDFPGGFNGDPKFLLERDTPVEAVAYLRAHPPRGKVWNDMVFGSYLTWAGFPDILPHADPRVEMYPLRFWEEYARLLSGPRNAAQTLESQNFSAALLHRKDGKRLMQQLQNSGWRVVSSHRDAVLLVAPRDVAQ